MAIPTRILVVLIGLRLLWPAGLCVCKLSSPVAHALVYLLGNDTPLPAHDDDDHHHPGCPASACAVGLGVHPANPVVDDPGAVSHPVHCPPSLEPRAHSDDAHSFFSATANAPPAYLSHCVFLL